MSKINISSILEKAAKATKTASFKKSIDQVVDRIMTEGSATNIGSGGNVVTISGVSMAASKFIEVLQNEIQSHAGSDFGSGELGPTAIDALVRLDHGEPTKIGRNKYQIAVWFSEDLSRESLCPNQYDGIDNIAALLNSGYSARHRVYGVWSNHGSDRQPSLADRAGTQFIENAIREYMANYASEYGVVDIEVDEIYK